MFLHKTPSFLFRMFPSLVWRVSTEARAIHLTFDDGPIPELTSWVLDTLNQFDAKATFFCVGENVEKHPEIFKQVINAGHSVGNHTFNHLNGWKTDNLSYLKNWLKADEVMRQYVQTDLFRPPYGRMNFRQMRQLKHKRVVMWDVLSGDFSSEIPPERILEKSIASTVAGSVVVFHDNIKATDNLKFVLPKYLAHFTEQGYTFSAL